MRMIIFLVSIITFVSASVSCTDENGTNMELTCEDSLVDLGTSAANWATSPVNHTEVNCSEFKSHLLLVLSNCDTEVYWNLYGGEDGWMDFVSDIEALDCSMFP